MKICTFKNCGRKKSAKGLCKVHYNMWKLTGKLHEIGTVARGGNGKGRRPGPLRICDVEGCGRKHEAKGYCKPHWRQHYAGLPITEPGIKRERNKGNCLANGCEKKASAKGYCLKHYERLRKHGDPNVCYTRKYRSENIHLDNVLRPHMTYFSTVDESKVIKEMFIESEKNDY